MISWGHFPFCKINKTLQLFATEPFRRDFCPRLAGVFRYAQTQHLVVFMAGGWIDAVVHSHLGMIWSTLSRRLLNCNGVGPFVFAMGWAGCQRCKTWKLNEIAAYSMVTFSEIWCHGVTFLFFCYGSSLEMHIVHSSEHTLGSFSHSLQIGWSSGVFPEIVASIGIPKSWLWL